MEHFEIVSSHPKLLSYIDFLQHKNAESLSFYPTQVFEREMNNNRLLMGLLDNEPCGYLYHGALHGNVKVHQVCIQYDLRRKLYGAMLIGYLEERSIKAGAQSVVLRCGFDLDANKFWQDLGYNCVGISEGGVRRMRKINIWQKALQPMFSLPTFIPAVGITDASIWRANKRDNKGSRFARGKRLKEYRDTLCK